MAVPSQKSQVVLDTFNSLHPRLQFIMEIGGKELKLFRYNNGVK